jgi:hypothetical protein
MAREHVASRDWTDPARWLAFLTVAVATVVFVLSSGKTASLLVYCAFWICAIVVPKSKRRVCVILYAACLASMLSPVDVQIRKTGRTGVRFLPSVYNLGASGSQRALEKKGLRENIDFVVIQYQTAFMKTYYVLTLFY